MKDYLVRAVDSTGKIKISVARTTDLVEKARQTHNTSATATAALGRVLTAGTLMATSLKNKTDVLTLSFAGNGPARGIHVVVKAGGNVKGYIGNPEADLPSKAGNELDVGGLVGKEGTLTTIMDLGLKEPYVGTTELVSGEIAEDLAHYYAISEQQPSVVSLGVLVEKDLSVKAAGGYIVQLLPDVSDEEISKIEENLAKVEAMSKMIDRGLSPEEIAKEVLTGFDVKILEKEDVAFECDCSKEKMTKALISIGAEEINSIIEEDGQAELVCHFCNTKHQFEKEDLQEIMLTINSN